MTKVECESSDDDDDHELLTLQLFTKSDRRKQTVLDRRVAKGFSILDEALQNADQMKEKDDRIALIKQKERDVITGGGATGDGSACNGSPSTSLFAKVQETIDNAKKHKEQSNKATKQQKDHEAAMIHGSVEDLEQVLGRQRCLELGKAIDTDAVTTLGARHTIMFTPTPPGSGYFDSDMTRADYLRQLKEILRKLVSSKQKILQAAWIQPLRKKSQDPADLQYFLKTHGLARARHEAGLVEIPQEIVLWLLRVSCGHDTGSPLEDFRTGALQTLQGLLRQNKNLQSNDPTIAPRLAPVSFALPQLAMQLQSWLVPACDNTTILRNNNHKSKASGSATISTTLPNNASGLERLLILWNTAFECDQVSGTDGEAAKHGMNCLGLLVKLGLDKEAVHSTKRNFRLKHHLRCVTSQLLRFVTPTLPQQGDSEVLEWTKEAAVGMVKDLVASNLGPGADDSEDMDDANACCSLALACEMLPTLTWTNSSHKSDCQFQKVAAQLKAQVSLQALQQLFQVASWEEEVYATVGEYQKAQKEGQDLVQRAKTDLIWLTLCSCLAAIIKINALRDAVEDDKPKYLAILTIALGRCLDVGMELMKDVVLEKEENDEDAPVNTTSANDSNNEYQTVEQARAVALLLGHVKLECTHLASRMNASMMTSHFRRVGYLVQCYNKYIMDVQPTAARHGGESSRKVVQHTLDRWVNKDNGKALDVSYEDKDEDDEIAMNPCKKQRTVLAPSV